MNSANAIPAPTWEKFLTEQKNAGYYQQLMTFLEEERSKYEVYPPEEDVFNAFTLCPLNKTKICIIGQDPYHNPGEAHGLSFSVRDGVKIPPSLKNIYQEINSDLGINIPTTGNLAPWAEQGVLLLNSILTVRKNEPSSHKYLGWHHLTDAAIYLLSISSKHPIVFILWGAFARSKKSFIEKRHVILESPHPSPFSAHTGFFGSKPFSKANQFLEAHNLTPINWQI